MIFTILLALAADFVRGAIVPLFAIVSIVRVVGEVIFLGHAFCIATHPMRRGWHDLWADSFVAPEPLPNAFAEAVSAESEPAVAARVRSGRRTSLGFAAFLLVLMLAQQVVGLFDPEARAKLADWVEIGDELVEGYSLDGLEFRFADAATTATLATAAAEEYVATFRFTRQRGPVRAEEMDDPTIRRQVEALLGDPGKAYAASPNALDIPIARVRRFRAQFTDRLDIVLFLYSSVGDRFWIAERPAAPGDGPIEYRWIDVEDAEHPPGSN
jgi:hypothetical protein